MTPADDPIRYPLGRFLPPAGYTPESRAVALDQLEQLPALLRAAVAGLNEAQLDRPYREGGWTVRQIVHHVADSHLQSYIRTKLVLYEEETVWKPSPWDTWSAFADAQAGPVEASLDLLSGLHSRWVRHLRSLPAERFACTMQHPAHGALSLDRVTALYAWHGAHHAAQIEGFRQRLGC